MSCSQPNRVFKVGVKYNGKNDLVFSNGHVDHLEYFGDKWHRIYDYPVSPKAERICREFIDVPCGKCLACRLDHSREWANRCLMEMAYHDSSLFLTLTYDDEHIPKKLFCTDDGKVALINNLDKKDAQDFLKRIRKYYEPKRIRFLLAGEYGSNTYRSHLHVILFGADLKDFPDMVFHSMSLDNPNYICPTLDNIWGKGHVLVSKATFENCAYTARYVVKKAGNENSDYIKKYGLQQEFISMSRRPGIGASYYYDHSDVFDYQNIIIGTEKGVKRFKQPRYFEKLLEKDDPDKLKAIKEKNNLFAKVSLKNKLRQTDMSLDEIYEAESNDLKKRTKSLERKKI